MYLNYDVVAMGYPGWTLNEIRGLTARQRKYWLRMLRWKKEKVNV